MSESITYNMDCLEYLRTVPDKYFDLACVDPPYGGGGDDNEYKGAVVGRFGGRFEKYHLGESSPPIKCQRSGGTWEKKSRRQVGAISSDDLAPDVRNTRGRFSKYADGGDIRHWDFAPPQEYFDELFRVSKHAIVWGGNYFDLPPTRCFLVWRKLTISENFTMAMAEYAWTNFNENAKVFECAPQGQKGDQRFHPTQKPIALYEWVFRLFAKPGDKILDTHLGSGSSRIAAYNSGLDFVGCEIDPVYFKMEEERFEKFVSQRSIFDADYGMADQSSMWEV